MTDDLVKRLRDPFYTPSLKSHTEAASHIEKLEAALRNIVEQIEPYDLPAPVVTLFVLQKARKALGLKND